MASKEFDQMYKEQLTKIFEGNGSITKTMLQDRLRLLGKLVSGNKSVLAECLLVALVTNGETTPNDLPLAADYITDEQELDTVDEEESDDEDDGDDGEGAEAADESYSRAGAGVVTTADRATAGSDKDVTEECAGLDLTG